MSEGRLWVRLKTGAGQKEDKQWVRRWPVAGKEDNCDSKGGQQQVKRTTIVGQKKVNCRSERRTTVG